MSLASLLSLPRDILVMLPEYLHTIEDLNNLSSTCRELRLCLSLADPNMILRLAAVQADRFFRPHPYLLLAATARELGDWARQSSHNEAELASKCEEQNFDAIFNLALQHCGLTMQRIRELHQMRSKLTYPMTGNQSESVEYRWGKYSRVPWQYLDPNYDHNDISELNTLREDSEEYFFALVIYTELFGPEYAHDLGPAHTARAVLTEETRMAYMNNVHKWDYMEDAESSMDYHPDPQLSSALLAKRLAPYLRHRPAVCWKIKDATKTKVFVLYA